MHRLNLRPSQQQRRYICSEIMIPSQSDHKWLDWSDCEFVAPPHNTAVGLEMDSEEVAFYGKVLEVASEALDYSSFFTVLVSEF